MRTILSNKNDIMKCVKAYGSSGFDNRKTSGQVQLVKTERSLALWIDQKESEGVDLEKREIIDKARLFYKAVCRRDVPFRLSRHHQVAVRRLSNHSCLPLPLPCT